MKKYFKTIPLYSHFLLIFLSPLAEGVSNNLESYNDRPDIIQLPDKIQAEAPPTPHTSLTLGRLSPDMKRAHLEAVAQLLGMYPEHELYFLARDSELLYDFAKLMMNQNGEETAQLHLINVSRDNMRSNNLKSFLEQEGLHETDLKLGKKILFVDTGFAGTIPKIISEQFPDPFKKNLQVQLMASANPAYPSSRVFLATLNPLASSEAPAKMHGTIIDYEYMPRYTNRSHQFEKWDGRWHPVSFIQKLPNQVGTTDGITDKNIALAYMKDLKNYSQNKHTLYLFNQRKALWSLLYQNTKEKNREKIKTDLLRILNSGLPSYGEAAVRDYLEIIQTNYPEFSSFIPSLYDLGLSAVQSKYIPNKNIIIEKKPEWKTLLENPETGIKTLLKEKQFHTLRLILDVLIDEEFTLLTIRSLLELTTQANATTQKEILATIDSMFQHPFHTNQLLLDAFVKPQAIAWKAPLEKFIQKKTTSLKDLNIIAYHLSTPYQTDDPWEQTRKLLRNQFQDYLFSPQPITVDLLDFFLLKGNINWDVEQKILREKINTEFQSLSDDTAIYVLKILVEAPCSTDWDEIWEQFYSKIYSMIQKNHFALLPAISELLESHLFKSESREVQRKTSLLQTVDQQIRKNLKCFDQTFFETFKKSLFPPSSNLKAITSLSESHIRSIQKWTPIVLNLLEDQFDQEHLSAGLWTLSALIDALYLSHQDLVFLEEKKLFERSLEQVFLNLNSEKLEPIFLTLQSALKKHLHLKAVFFHLLAKKIHSLPIEEVNLLLLKMPIMLKMDFITNPMVPFQLEKLKKNLFHYLDDLKINFQKAFEAKMILKQPFAKNWQELKAKFNQQLIQAIDSLDFEKDSHRYELSRLIQKFDCTDHMEIKEALKRQLKNYSHQLSKKLELNALFHLGFIPEIFHYSPEFFIGDPALLHFFQIWTKKALDKKGVNQDNFFSFLRLLTDPLTQNWLEEKTSFIQILKDHLQKMDLLELSGSLPQLLSPLKEKDPSSQPILKLISQSIESLPDNQLIPFIQNLTKIHHTCLNFPSEIQTAIQLKIKKTVIQLDEEQSLNIYPFLFRTKMGNTFFREKAQYLSQLFELVSKNSNPIYLGKLMRNVVLSEFENPHAEEKRIVIKRVLEWSLSAPLSELKDFITESGNYYFHRQGMLLLYKIVKESLQYPEDSARKAFLSQSFSLNMSSILNDSF